MNIQMTPYQTDVDFQQKLKAIPGVFVAEQTDHQRITDAGWSYRPNDRGRIIYRDPKTGKWHTYSEAISILQARASSESVPRVVKAAV